MANEKRDRRRNVLKIHTGEKVAGRKNEWMKNCKNEKLTIRKKMPKRKNEWTKNILTKKYITKNAGRKTARRKYVGQKFADEKMSKPDENRS